MDIQTSATSSYIGTRGFQEETRSTAKELERCQERSRGKWASAGTRLKRTGGAGGIVSPNASLTRDEPGIKNQVI